MVGLDIGSSGWSERYRRGEVLTYASKRIIKRHGHVLFVLNTSSEKVESETYFFEFREGVLRRYWHEASRSRFVGISIVFEAATRKWKLVAV